MALITDFPTNFTSALNAISGSQIYTDIQAMYAAGTLQKDQYEKIIIAFHEKALGVAGTITENITVKGYRLDEIISKDLEVKTNEISVRNAELALRTAESAKDLEVKTNEISVRDAELALRTAESAKDLEVKTNEISVRNADLALKQAINEKDIDLKVKQILSESQRLLLMVAQTKGFDDNVTLEFAKFLSENIGMIESGGNTAPQALWDLWTISTNDMKTISQKHPELTP